MRLLGLTTLCLFIACSGGSSNAPDPEVGGGGGTTDEAPDKEALCTHAMESAQAAHEEAWEAILAKGAPKTLEDVAAAACQRFCGRSTECAIEDSCNELDAPAIAKLQFDKTAPENTRQCLDKCHGWRMTKQQVVALGTCSQDDESSCATFLECSDAAKR